MLLKKISDNISESKFITRNSEKRKQNCHCSVHCNVNKQFSGHITKQTSSGQMANFAVVIYNKKQPFSNLKLKPFCLTHPRHTYAPLFMLLTMSKNRFLEFVFAVCFFFLCSFYFRCVFYWI